MASYIDWFVASVAFVGAALALVAGAGSWPSPYRLRTIAAIVDRYGMSAARGVWIAIAVIAIIAGVVIATGVRPEYAQPSKAQIDHAD